MTYATRMLIVEPRARLGETLVKILRENGYDVSHAHSTAEAVEHAAQSPPKLVLAAYDVLKDDEPQRWQAHVETPLSRVSRVVIASDSKREILKEILRASEYNRDILVPPLEPVTLLSAVRSAIGERAARSFNRGSILSALPNTPNGYIVDLSEKGLGLQLPFPIDGNAPIVVETPIWAEIGIEPPVGRVTYCAPMNPRARTPKSYRIGVLLVGLSGTEQRLIRQWVFRSQSKKLS